MMEFDADQKATFLATVERYNGLVAAGEDTDFGKPAYRLSDVETAPFFAARIGGELAGDHSRRHHGRELQPLKNDGTPIEGLYVCGNDQGGFYPHSYPSNFTGINAGRTATNRPHRRQARLGRGIGATWLGDRSCSGRGGFFPGGGLSRRLPSAGVTFRAPPSRELIGSCCAKITVARGR